MVDLILSLEATCDLDKETIRKYDLSVVDMEFKVGDEYFNTAENDVVSSKLYEKMTQKQRTSTSQINAYDYEQHFFKLLKQNKPVLHLAFSSITFGSSFRFSLYDSSLLVAAVFSVKIFSRSS